MAWLRNKKTGGWFEIPDDQLDTSRYMNSKIRASQIRGRENKELNAPDEDFYYHNTKKEHLSNIAKEGLLPNTEIGWNTKGLFFGENENREQNQVYGDTELRVLKSHAGYIQRYIGNVYTTGKIDSKWIQIKNKKTNKWQWLVK